MPVFGSLISFEEIDNIVDLAFPRYRKVEELRAKARKEEPLDTLGRWSAIVRGGLNGSVESLLVGGTESAALITAGSCFLGALAAGYPSRGRLAGPGCRVGMKLGLKVSAELVKRYGAKAGLLAFSHASIGALDEAKQALAAEQRGKYYEAVKLWEALGADLSAGVPSMMSISLPRVVKVPSAFRLSTTLARSVIPTNVPVARMPQSNFSVALGEGLAILGSGHKPAVFSLEPRAINFDIWPPTGSSYADTRRALQALDADTKRVSLKCPHAQEALTRCAEARVETMAELVPVISGCFQEFVDAGGVTPLLRDHEILGAVAQTKKAYRTQPTQILDVLSRRIGERNIRQWLHRNRDDASVVASLELLETWKTGVERTLDAELSVALTTLGRFVSGLIQAIPELWFAEFKEPITLAAWKQISYLSQPLLLVLAGNTAKVDAAVVRSLFDRNRVLKNLTFKKVGDQILVDLSQEYLRYTIFDELKEIEFLRNQRANNPRLMPNDKQLVGAFEVSTKCPALFAIVSPGQINVVTALLKEYLKFANKFILTQAILDDMNTYIMGAAAEQSK